MCILELYVKYLKINILLKIKNKPHLNNDSGPHIKPIYKFMYIKDVSIYTFFGEKV